MVKAVAADFACTYTTESEELREPVIERHRSSHARSSATLFPLVLSSVMAHLPVGVDVGISSMLLCNDM